MTVINGTTGVDKVQDNTIGFVDMIGTEWDNSKATNGYTKLPNGLIMQWGTGSNASYQYTITYPIAFPNACLMAQANLLASSGSGDTGAVVSFNSTSVTVYMYTGGTHQCTWFAIGY